MNDGRRTWSRDGETDGFAYLFQVVVDVMQCRVVLLTDVVFILSCIVFMMVNKMVQERETMKMHVRVFLDEVGSTCTVVFSDTESGFTLNIPV